VSNNLAKSVAAAVLGEEAVENTEVDAAEMERDVVDTTVVSNLTMMVSWLQPMIDLLDNVAEEVNAAAVVATSTTVEEPKKEKVTSKEVETEEVAEVAVKASPDKTKQTLVTKNLHEVIKQHEQATAAISE